MEAEAEAEAEAERLRELAVAIWVNSHKHHEPLHRGLAAMIPLGIQGERTVLLPLWYAPATGEDAGTLLRQEIHGLMAIVRAVQRHAGGSEVLAVLGAQLRSRAAARS